MLRGVRRLGILVVLLSTGFLRATPPLSPKGVVAAAPGDAYRVLAEEIARETGYPLVDSPLAALDLNPVFLIWVVSPAAASDRDFVAYGQAVKDRESVVALESYQLNPLENQRRLAGERRELTGQCRGRLRNPIKRWIFSRSLRRAQKLTVNREVWKSQAVRQIAVFRKVLLTLGQRLREQGILADCDDIVFLEVSEVEPVALGTACFDARGRVAARRKQYQRNLGLKPPPVVVGRFCQNPPDAPVPDGKLEVLEGIPVSPGIVTGPAKVILRNNDHEQVLPGEILIAPFTDPARTPYFVTAAGVVMDQGGTLSHGSIVAREYGLPAVTNVSSATHIIRTGDRVQVDGNRGRVIILKRADQQQPTPPTLKPDAHSLHPWQGEIR